MLAGLFEFPAIDLAPEDSPLKASARSLRLDKLVRSLIDTSDCSLWSPKDASDGGALVSRTSLPTVTQVYSHITRTYLAERVVLSSPSLPPLRPASKRAPADSASVQSRAGAARWIPASQVASANVGGAVGKIWDERNSVVSGGGGGGGGKKVGTSGKKAGHKGKNGSTAAAPEKGQASLAGFFMKKGPSEPRPPPPSSSSAEHESAAPSAVTAEDDDDIVIVETTATTGRVAEAGVRTALKSSPVKVYKKRRIASDSEDE